MNHVPVYNLELGIYHEFAPLLVSGCLGGHVQWELSQCFKTGLEFLESTNRSF